MKKAELGDTVKVAYKGTLKDGTVFDQTKSDNYLEFKIGDKRLIPGFEQAVVGMKQGDVKTITIPAKEAYGDYQEEEVLSVSKSNFPDHIQPEIGLKLKLQNTDGTNVIVTVIDFDENSVTLDANHALAGKDLTFEITLKEIA